MPVQVEIPTRLVVDPLGLRQRRGCIVDALGGAVRRAVNDSHEIVVSEGGLSRGRIAIIWDEPGAALGVTVLDPSMSPLVDGVGRLAANCPGPVAPAASAGDRAVRKPGPGFGSQQGRDTAM